MTHTATRAAAPRHENVLNQWLELKQQGLNVREAAERLGMTRQALEKVIQRARAKGDPRVAPAGPRPNTSVGDTLDTGPSPRNKPEERAAVRRLVPRILPVEAERYDGEQADILAMLGCTETAVTK